MDLLRCLQVGCIDLVPHHAILRSEDPYRIFDEAWADVALEVARGYATPAKSTTAHGRPAVAELA